MHSFDIFDTLITRTAKDPHGIFAYVEKILNMEKYQNIFPDYIRNNYYDLRIDAEKFASYCCFGQQYTLSDIYACFSKMTGLSEEQEKILIDLEIKTEWNNIVPITKNILLLKKYLADGETVILISDMYLSEKIIRYLLAKIDDVFISLPVYVSSEYCVSKANGLLYDVIKKTQLKQNEPWIHYGDNQVADIENARAMGIAPIWLKKEEPVNWEYDFLLKYGNNHDYLKQASFGIAKNIRINHDLNNYEMIGASLGGMVLTPYVEWIIRNCMNIGVRSIYFIARDGYVLQKMADIYLTVNMIDINTHYLYGSRMVWRSKDMEKNKLVLEYFEQEIDFKEKNIVFVDLQGTGKTLENVASIIHQKYNVQIHAFYFDLFNNIENAQCTFHAFTSIQSCKYIEILCRAPHGQTNGYELRNGTVVPVLSDIDKSKFDECGLNDYVKGLELFSKAFFMFLKVNDIRNVGFSLSKQILEYCTLNPVKDILDFLGDMPHVSESSCGCEHEYARGLSRSDVFRIFMLRSFESLNAVYDGEDLDLSLKRSKETVKKYALFCDAHYGKILGCLFHMDKRFRQLRYYHKRERIIIYAAGKVGKELYRKLLYHQDYKVVAWTDIRHESYRKAGYPVVPLKRALAQKFDYVLIALAGPPKYLVQRQLLDLGVDNKRIILYEDFIKKFEI